MNQRSANAVVIILALLAGSTAAADVGVGVKAGTLGIGLEGRWEPIPWFDLRIGANYYDYEDAGAYSGINYNANLTLDTYYLTGSFKFPLSPFRLTAGAFSNGNQVQMQSQDTGGANFNIGGVSFSSTDVGALRSITSFGSTAPYLGVGFDFELFGKAGLNLDFGVLWQGEPQVALDATGLASAPQVVQDALAPALEAERLELQDEMSDYKAWPVVSLGLVYNF